MITQADPFSVRGAHGQQAMTLVEVIGVLAVIAILAAVALPALIKQTDKAVSDQEMAALQSFGDALQRKAMRTGYIPGQRDWTTNIATELGLAPSNVATNLRHQSRYLIFDPAFTNTLTIPYVQGNLGARSAATSARLLLLSSLGKPLPNLSSGMSSNDFSIVWGTADGTLPSAAVFSGWGGTGDDLKVQRINLGSAFVHLVLCEYASTAPSVSYSIGTNVLGTVTPSSPLDGYFLKGTMINLYTNSPTGLGLQLVLNEDCSYWYYQDVWRGFMPGTTGVPGAPSTTNLIAAFDFSAIVNGFLNASPTSLGTNQQAVVVQDFIDYMNNYNAWANSHFTNSLSYDLATAAQVKMMNDLANLINAIRPQ